MRGFHGEYAVLSNAVGVVPLDGKAYPSVWHAYAASFQFAPEAKDEIAKAPTVAAALFLAKREIREQPEQTKLDAMAQFLRLKFDLHDEYRLLLLGTGQWKLIAENEPPGDRFWGVSGGAGRNELGKLLMTLREEYRRDA